MSEWESGAALEVSGVRCGRERREEEERRRIEEIKRIEELKRLEELRRIEEERKIEQERILEYSLDWFDEVRLQSSRVLLLGVAGN